MFSGDILLKEASNKMFSMSLFFFCVFAWSVSSTQVDLHASDWKAWTVQLIETRILAWTFLGFDFSTGNENSAESYRIYYNLPTSTVHYALCCWKIHLMTHFTNYISFSPFLFIYVIQLWKSASRRRHTLLKGQLWLWKVNDILILQCHFFFSGPMLLIWPLIFWNMLG